MKIKKVFLLVIPFLFFSKPAVNSIQNHFYDNDDKPLEKVEFIYDELKKYFKNKMPGKITVKYVKTEIKIFEDDNSYFNPGNGSVLINEAHKSDLVKIVAHETSHLCMAYITSNLSINENYRFLDEGFASIFDKIAVGKYENIALNELEEYKKNALAISANQNVKGNVDFKKVQKWSEYYGDAGKKTNYYAYPVGSSFVFYIFDAYSNESFFQFLIDLAKTDNLDKSFRNIFKKNKSEIEKEWQDYLKKVKLD